jgi:hypothetical protein
MRKPRPQPRRFLMPPPSAEAGDQQLERAAPAGKPAPSLRHSCAQRRLGDCNRPHRRRSAPRLASSGLRSARRTRTPTPAAGYARSRQMPRPDPDRQPPPPRACAARLLAVPRRRTCTETATRRPRRRRTNAPATATSNAMAEGGAPRTGFEKKRAPWRAGGCRLGVLALTDHPRFRR